LAANVSSPTSAQAHIVTRAPRSRQSPRRNSGLDQRGAGVLCGLVALLERLEDDDRGLFDRAPGDVDHGPVRVAREDLARVLDLFFDLLFETVRGVDAHPELLQARLADLDERLEPDRET